MEKQFKVTISGESETEIKRKVSAIMTILKNVPTEHLFTIADSIKKDPSVINKVIKLSNNKMVQKIF